MFFGILLWHSRRENRMTLVIEIFTLTGSWILIRQQLCSCQMELNWRRKPLFYSRETKNQVVSNLQHGPNPNKNKTRDNAIFQIFYVKLNFQSFGYAITSRNHDHLCLSFISWHFSFSLPLASLFRYCCRMLPNHF